MKKKKRRSVDKFFVSLLLLDQFLKVFLLNFGEVSFNKGVGFGLMPVLWPKSLVVLIVLLLIFWYIKSERVGERFIVIGGISNLIDRLFFGQVIDYLSLEVVSLWFNLGDLYINIGILLLLWNYLREDKQSLVELGNGSNL